MDINSTNPAIELTAHSRCDRCGAQAYALAQRDNLELMFCAHHASKNIASLEDDGWRISFDAAKYEQDTGEKVPAV